MDSPWVSDCDLTGCQRDLLSRGCDVSDFVGPSGAGEGDPRQHCGRSDKLPHFGHDLDLHSCRDLFDARQVGLDGLLQLRDGLVQGLERLLGCLRFIAKGANFAL